MTSCSRVLRVVFALAMSLLLPAGAVRAQSPPASSAPALPDVQKLGPQVGDRVPDFTLTDQEGHPRTLASLMGTRGLMLVFFRSADW
jgi:cytochrome oxidase Cu insertion factor (SCO1/SenC/PrrC family)